MDRSKEATARAERRRAKEPSAVTVRYDRARDRIVIALSSGAEFAFPRNLAQGLEAADPADLDIIEISPSGFGLHFPKLDSDLWLPALLEGIFGSRRWMAAQLGARGGRAKTTAKIKAARANGALGGRPRKAKVKATATHAANPTRHKRSR